MNMKRTIPLLTSLFLFALLWTQNPAKAATTLIAGDIAIIGFNFVDPDQFAFVPLENIDAGAQITFTDNGWLNAGGFRTNEGTFTWTAPSTICAGQVVIPDLSSVQFSISGDQILAYQGSATSPTFIYALNSDDATWAADATSSNTSALPTGLTNGTTAVAIPEIDNAIYTGTTTGTRASLLAAISDSANWAGSNTPRQTMPSGPFNVTDATNCDTPPRISSTNPADGATNVAVGTTITLNFNENVDLTSSAVTLECPASSSVSFTGLPAIDVTSITLTPTSDLPEDIICTVTAVDTEITDSTGNDLDGNGDGTAGDSYQFTFTTASTTTAEIVINEFLADPAADIAGDANGDGTRDAEDDEFVEIVNISGTALDISGWTVSDSVGVRHTFPVNTIVPTDCAIVVFGGGTPTGSFGNVTVQTASGGLLGLNNSGDTITVSDGANNYSYTYGGEGGSDTSLTLDPDITGGSYAQHDSIAAAGGALFSPGTQIDGSAFTGCSSIDVAPTVSSTSPVNGAINVVVDAAVTVTFSEDVTFSNTATFACDGASGNFTVTTTGGPVTWTITPPSDLVNNETCTVTLTATDVTDLDGTPDIMAADYIFGFTTIGSGGSCGPAPTLLIHTIQGNGAASPYDGQTHTIEGIVVGDFQDTDELDGFYVQEEDADADADLATSEGIFVYDTFNAVDVGDHVSVTGVVDEYFELTEITSVSDVTVCASGEPLPTAVSVSLPVSAITDFEAFEGMLTIFPQTLTATEHYNLGRYGNVLLSSNSRLMNPTQVANPGAPATAVRDANLLNQILLDDGSTVQNPDPIVYPDPGLSAANTLRTGDTVTDLAAILTYDYDIYRLHPTTTPAFVAANPRPAAPADVGGTLKVASFNVLNYFTTLGSRGADSTSEFTRQHNKIVEALATINADVVGLIEIENNATTAIESLVNGLNIELGAGTYAYINTGVIGSDQIKLAIIYKPASVTPIGSHAILTSSFDPDFLDNKNRPTLAQTFEDGSGERFTIAVNHLKSKGSACDDVGDPNTGDGQGNCNLTRTDAANVLAAWLATDPTGSGDPDFIIMGDLNAYAREDPIIALKSAGYTNLFAAFEQASYSYVFDGEFGTLDYIMGNASLTRQVTGATAWHINSDEPRSLDYNEEFKTPGQVISLYAPDAYRASDHDPVIIGLDLDSTTTADFSDLDSVYDTAWHIGSGAIRLGSLWDADTTFAPNDDNASDDGVTIGPGTGGSGQWQPGPDGASLNIEVTGGSGCLYAWVDWNDDGLFDDREDPGNMEYAIRSIIVNAGTANYAFDVPANEFQTPPGDSTPLQSYNVRVRLYETCASGPTGAAVNGEVEDYTFAFTPTAVTLQSFSATNQNTLWLAVLLVVVTLVAGSWLMWRNGRSRQ